MNFVKENKVIKNIVNMGILKIISIITNFILVGVIYRYLNNQELNGVWLTIFSILSWITLCDFGMGNGLRNKLTEVVVKKDYDRAQKYISTTYFFMAIPIMILILISVIVTKVIDWNRLFNIKGIELTNDYLGKFVLIAIVLYSIKFYMSIINSLYYALFKNYVVTLMQAIDSSTNILIISILTILGINDILILAIVYGGVSIVTLMIFSLIIFKRSKGRLTPSLTKIDKNTITVIGGVGLKFLVLQIAIIVLFTTDNIIISKFIGVNEVTPYQLTNKLLSIFKIGLGIVLTNIWGMILELMALDKNEEIKVVVNKVLKVFIIFSIGTIMLGLVSNKIINIWIGSQINISGTLIIFMIIYNILHMWCDIFQNISNGLNKLNIQVFSYGIATIINIPLSIYLVKTTNLGVSAVILATIISLLIPGFILPMFLSNFFKKGKEQ